MRRKMVVEALIETDSATGQLNEPMFWLGKIERWLKKMETAALRPWAQSATMEPELKTAPQ